MIQVWSELYWKISTGTDMYWRAGQTTITHLSYQQKEDFFGKKFNLLGFDYYKGGVYESLKKLSNTKQTSEYINSFDWRNRHGANNPNSPYFDGDYQYLSDDFVSVQYKLPLYCSEGLIKVSSIDGKVIRKMIVSSNQNQIQLSLTNVNANQLIVTLIDCNSGTTSVKLITK